MTGKRTLMKTCIVFVLSFLFVIGNLAAVYAANKSVSVIINKATVVINGATAFIDTIEYGGKQYIQIQDLCSYLGIDYVYTAKTKTVDIKNQKPAKPIPPASSIYSTVPIATSKKITVQENPLTIKLNGTKIKAQHLLIGSSIFGGVSDIAPQLARDAVYDPKTNTLTVTDRKPSTPVMKPSTTAVTDKPVTLTIDNWGSASKREYMIDGGQWTEYTAPITIPYNQTVYARGTNALNAPSDIAKIDITNIRRLLDKVNVSKMTNMAVKVTCYDVTSREVSSGSGFIVSSDGKIVTNYHVIDLATRIKVKTYDGKEYDVLGVTAYNKGQDLAVIKIDKAYYLPKATLGDSSKVNTGEEIVTMGHPLGLNMTVAFGNISGTNVNFSNDLPNIIQISAPVSHGNSGGPLLNMYGEVIGINFYSISVNNAQNMNYAIPINLVKPLLASNTVKTLAAVIAEVYPSMNYDVLAYYMYCNYPSYVSGDYTFTFTNFFLDEDKDDSNILYIDVFMNSYEYSEVLMAELEGNRAVVEKWVDGIYQAVKAKFPNKEIYLYLYLSASFNTKPGGYNPDEIEFDSQTNKWDVFRVKLIYYYNGTTPNPKWLM